MGRPRKVLNPLHDAPTGADAPTEEQIEQARALLASVGETTIPTPPPPIVDLETADRLGTKTVLVERTKEVPAIGQDGRPMRTEKGMVYDIKTIVEREVHTTSGLSLEEAKMFPKELWTPMSKDQWTIKNVPTSGEFHKTGQRRLVITQKIYDQL